MRVQYASCARSNTGVCLKLVSAAMPFVSLCCCCAAAGVAAGSAQQQLQQPNAAAALPATTPAAAVAASFDVLLLLLSLACAGEAISSAQAPLEVGR